MLTEPLQLMSLIAARAWNHVKWARQEVGDGACSAHGAGSWSTRAAGDDGGQRAHD
jgi:hypothetical protein